MNQKIFRSIFAISALVLILCHIVVFGILYNYFSDVQAKQLLAQTKLVAQAVEDEKINYLENLTENTYRITWVDSDGTVLFDNQADPTSMENHLKREEIAAALKYGSGQSERNSNTLSEKTLYQAQRLDDGTVIRLAITERSIWQLVLGMLYPLCILLTLALILSAWLAQHLSKRIVEPLNNLNLEQPLTNDTYPEISPLLSRIESQHKQIQLQIAELMRKQDEFAAVTNNMSEGLILLNEKSQVLSINRAACDLFGVDSNWIGKSILAVERSQPVRELVKQANLGQTAEAMLTTGGRQYQMDANPVISDQKQVGICLLVFDITEKAQAEQLRREFSANVSHELKTPLQSISGAAELIKNGLVKTDDLSRFAAHIYTEAQRMIHLIEDIIRLSQLDEGGVMPEENVNLKQLVYEIADTLSSIAEQRQITIDINSDDIAVHGVRRLFYEIIYNLCENTIKYNKDHGVVNIAIKKLPDSVELSVKDTGIGIPPEHQGRVFERFYRVDKSHSKETGGTGLGLSIVKHAVLYLGADISLTSEPGQGTCITVRFPQNPKIV